MQDLIGNCITCLAELHQSKKGSIKYNHDVIFIKLRLCPYLIWWCIGTHNVEEWQPGLTLHKLINRSLSLHANSCQVPKGIIKFEKVSYNNSTHFMPIQAATGCNLVRRINLIVISFSELVFGFSKWTFDSIYFIGNNDIWLINIRDFTVSYHTNGTGIQQILLLLSVTISLWHIFFTSCNKYL